MSVMQVYNICFNELQHVVCTISLLVLHVISALLLARKKDSSSFITFGHVINTRKDWHRVTWWVQYTIIYAIVSNCVDVIGISKQFAWYIDHSWRPILLSVARIHLSWLLPFSYHRHMSYEVDSTCTHPWCLEYWYAPHYTLKENQRRRTFW